MKLLSNHISLLIITLLFCCCSQGNINEYYPDGTLKLKGELKDGKRNGQFTTYYPDGSVESEYLVKDEVLHGNKITYSTTGEKNSEETYTNGLLHGPIKRYNNGQLTYEANYRQGKPYGEVRHFRENGNLEKLTSYNEDGIYYTAHYDQNGKFEVDMYKPTFAVKSDTVQFGEEYSVIIKMPEPLIGKATIYIGELDKYGHLATFADTLQAADNRSYKYTVRPKKVGDNILAGCIYLAQPDAYGVSAFDFKHKFTVIE